MCAIVCKSSSDVAKGTEIHWKWKLNYCKGNGCACVEGNISRTNGNFGFRFGKIRFIFEGSHPVMCLHLFTVSVPSIHHACKDQMYYYNWAMSGDMGSHWTKIWLYLNPLKHNDTYRHRTAPLTSKCCILYIYSKNICTEYFKHGI